ncbi:hypothetical protein Zmor_007727 [Zophobas morio]|uniref:glutathione transferase n=1 Tax=Zophobas morio TaxID=2755281 RepID=A0AA38IXD2_9CUCU|nr:hypothetical protein Zmor_007727 [Zophobas morio]
MAPSYKLIYFPTRGWAEPIRFILSYGGVEFEDARIPHDKWPALKDQTPFGHLPVLEHNGKQAGQSIAIARYAAKQVKLAGKDDWEDLEIDAVVDTIKDSCLKLSGLRTETDEEKKKALRENVLKEVLPYYLKRFDELCQKNNGYLAAGRLTWADLYFVSMSQALDIVAGFNILKDYPKLAALKEKILEIPNIKKWVETRPKSEF